MFAYACDLYWTFCIQYQSVLLTTYHRHYECHDIISVFCKNTHRKFATCFIIFFPYSLLYLLQIPHYVGYFTREKIIWCSLLFMLSWDRDFILFFDTISIGFQYVTLGISHFFVYLVKSRLLMLDLQQLQILFAMR
jgi:hypothetical protein